MNHAAVDFESYYDDECSIQVLGVDGYILHPKYDVYQVAIVASTGLEWVGHPSEAPWQEIAGDEWEWLAHNAGFDERVHYYLRKFGRVPELNPRLWHCTADLCAFSAAPRALAAASVYLYQEKVSKDYRGKMKGKIFASLSPKIQAEVREAGLIDGRKCKRFFDDLSPNWPERERRISRLSRQQAWHGLRLDKAALEQDMQLLKTLVWTAEQMIPWNGVEANLSYEALVAECQKVGIQAPPSTAMTSDDCAIWEDTYGDQYPWIDAMRTSRRANALLKKCETMYRRIRESDGRMPYENKYFGAHTGRWGDGGENTGRMKSGGFNSRNLPRKEMFGEDYFLGKKNMIADLQDPKKKIWDGTREEAIGKRFAKIWEPGMRGVNLRNRIIPAEGCHFVIPDLAQIEPRVLWSFTGDHVALAMVRTGLSPYEAHAISSMGWTGEPLKKLAEVDMAALSLYQLAKARVLALGYQAGWVKFIMMAPIYIPKEDCERIFSAPVSEEDVARFQNYLSKCRVKEWLALWAKADEKLRTTYVNSWLIVSGFRASNPKTVKLWKKMQRHLNDAIGDDLEIGLPSGRSLIYRKVAKEDGEIRGTVMKNGKPQRMKLYGGLLTENLCQAVARDIFGECLLRLDDKGYWTALHAHDEAVDEVPLSVTTAVIGEIMSQAPDWMPNIPVASDVKDVMFYTK